MAPKQVHTYKFIFLGQSCGEAGDIRIVQDQILEVCINVLGTNELRWHTVCSDNFGPNEATAACRQLGFASASKS